jgi:5-oxoprolinase (ATP-hydrolysing)
MDNGWQFFIDRGGTFTDVVAISPSGQLHVHKLLSEDPQRYPDATLQGIKDVLQLKPGDALPAEAIECVRLGTTLATNALLERHGARTVLVTTKGFADALRIGYQNRPDIFALNIQVPGVLFERVIEVDERIDAHGLVLAHPDKATLKLQLASAFDAGIRSCAILFMHGYRYPAHEQLAEEVARELGFRYISTSYKVMPLIKFVSRGDTTTADAYLTPVLADYVETLASNLRNTHLYFIQSNGGLAAASHFRGRDSVVSGPAGGVVGAIKSAQFTGEQKILTFDMGGTSTDVAHYDGQLERTSENQIGGVRMRAPMLSIHTVAAGGGSIITFDGARFKVGPESAGANPGPACYRRGGPLTITDCNLLLGRIQPKFFPKVFGASGDQELDVQIAAAKFDALTKQVAAATGANPTTAEVAYGFLRIAVQKMSTAIKEVSTQKGHDPSEYALVCFGGAGGQHACLIAETLGIKRVLIHPLAGVLSAFGIGMADVSVIEKTSVEKPLGPQVMPDLLAAMQSLQKRAKEKLAQQITAGVQTKLLRTAHLRYEGTDFSLPVAFADSAPMKQSFTAQHKQRYGFEQPGKQVIIESIEAEAIGMTPPLPVATPSIMQQERSETDTQHVDVFFPGGFRKTPLYLRPAIQRDRQIAGPAIIVEANSTIIVEPNWCAQMIEDGTLKLTHDAGRCMAPPVQTAPAESTSVSPDPILLEVFNNLFMFIAEQMGITLQNTSHSVNIKERLDFSCAIFDEHGNLVANAPHIPVHLGSMGESVRELITKVGNRLQPGDMYALNDPYNGGTHLPDVTVLTAYFHESTPLFYIAARGHHADIGGITPGSMPPFSKTLHEEGVLLSMVKVAAEGRLFEKELIDLLSAGRYPSRNPQQNIADLSAQVAALHRGLAEIDTMIGHYGASTVRAYMQYVQANAEESVRRLITSLHDGAFTSQLDNGAQISVSVAVDREKRSAVIDFTGTTMQTNDNFNAPRAICRAAVLYVFRTLVDEDIPLNDGCLKPLQIIIPSGSLLNPTYPAAVVAGNVETSQVISDTLYAALGKLSASQGTMNNFTFGNDKYQYYETICGGAGAGETFDGCDAVQTHMTNSRLTDPEVLEWRFPILVKEFSIRHDSGGAGEHHGGCGTVRKLQFLEPMTASILSNRRSTAPFGLQGGLPGSAGKNYIQQSDGRRIELTACRQHEMQPGDIFVIETPGGGGFGTPVHRGDKLI